MNVRLTQIDGALPNIALMKLSHYHKSIGDYVHLTRHIEPDLFEPDYDLVIGSAIFNFSIDRITRFKRQWPISVLGGSGVREGKSLVTVEDLIGLDEYEYYDYSDYDVDYSIGFTQRGCRLNCKFCGVPDKEGAN